LDRLDRLMSNDDFNYFVGKYLVPMLVDYRDQALNVIGNTPDARAKFAERHYALNAALMKLQEECHRLRMEIAQ
jgi:hypothetical protein